MILHTTMASSMSFYRSSCCLRDDTSSTISRSLDLSLARSLARAISSCSLMKHTNRGGAIQTYNVVQRKRKPRVLFLFNDVLLIAKREGKAKYWLKTYIRLRGELKLEDVQTKLVPNGACSGLLAYSVEWCGGGASERASLFVVGSRGSKREGH